MRIFRWNTKHISEDKLLQWSTQFGYCLFLDPHQWQKDYPHGAFPKLLGVSNTKSSQHFLSGTVSYKYLLGYLGYDFKNQIEKLFSSHPDFLGFEDACCFEPDYLFLWKENNILEVHLHSPIESQALLDSIAQTPLSAPIQYPKPTIQTKTDFETYQKNILHIKNHIEQGDVYELNYCIDFFAENAKIDPLQTYKKLTKLSPMPFCAFLKIEEKYALCASPERFLKKTGHKIISQPIKGTIGRGASPQEDAQNKYVLAHSEKEIAENMMIVDLVRNDLARSASVGTTRVSELFGIYTFRQVHQMISTIEAEVPPQMTPATIIKNAFPMGSMTGAPKIKAMELIEQYETMRRGLFSGAIGFMTPTGDFDLNVVIRTIFYSSNTQYLCFKVGSAITYDSNPQEEYHECMLKAKAIREVLET